MSIQLVTSSGAKSINIEGSVISNDNQKIIILMNHESLSDDERHLLESENSFYFYLNHDQEPIKTKSHFIQSSVSLGGVLLNS